MAMQIFLANLEKIRLYNNWKVEEMCEHLDFGVSTLHSWKSGKNKPTFTMLEQIARNLNITLSELLWENYVPDRGGKIEQEVALLSQFRRIDESFRIIHSHLLIEFSDALSAIFETEKRP